MTLTSAQAGFIKGLALTLIFAAVTFFGDAQNLQGIMSPGLAALVAALASSLESHLKAKSDGTVALLGAARIKKA